MISKRTEDTIKLLLKRTQLTELEAATTEDYIAHCFEETPETIEYWSFVEGFIYGGGGN